MKSADCLVFSLVAVLLLASGSAWGRANGIVVSTKAGRVSGIRPPGTRVISFKGIPYARPPVGALRWKAPQPVAPWQGIREAKKFGDSCMQATPHEMLPWTPVFMTQLPVSEDCLFLNVWTPKVGSDADLPVLVFIHGGGFVGGAGSIRIYNGQHLASEGMVVVTLNYRLGVFGFFADKLLAEESKHHSSGNYGLLDQMAALRWVKKNIANFGGNPQNVTIWGQSAGAMSVEALLLSPLAKGLFDRAQADSGIGVATGLEHNLIDAEQNGSTFARSIGASSLSALRAVPAKKLLREAEHYARKQGRPFGFLPDIDGWVLPANLRKLIANGSGSNVPMIIGWNANDWMLFQRPVSSVDQYKQYARKFYGPMHTQFLKLYPASNATQAKRMQALSSQDRDRVQTWLWAARRYKSSKITSNVYLYFFQRAIPWPKHPNFGAFHSSELPYFFRNLRFMSRPWRPIDHALSRKMAKYLLHFAMTGNPNGPELPKWQPLLTSQTAMRFSKHPGSMPICSSTERCSFWRKYFKSRVSHHAPTF